MSNGVRADIPFGLPKWIDCAPDHVRQMINVIQRHQGAIGIHRIRKEGARLDAFQEQTALLQGAFGRSDGRGHASWAKPPNALKSYLFFGSIAIGVATAVRAHCDRLIKTDPFLAEVTHRPVLDAEVDGREMQTLFANVLAKQSTTPQKTESLGVRFLHCAPTYSDDMREPLLLMADHLAGMAQIAGNPGSPHVTAEMAAMVEAAFRVLSNSGKLSIVDRQFDLSWDEMLGAELTAFAQQALNTSA
ncbi:hypothetical protein [Ottowia sp.]|uniref:hypothetical protein n=1 Tax=Ottowia sp. TaxID=1898956 RepID=UPI002C1D17B7|nr:hypothetical protein [Ottowia sp.]HRN77202.1 hypothetical protein [Ottowia sp.]HRQ04045.1 hypothetical protein [Ottowia sp.]